MNRKLFDQFLATSPFLGKSSLGIRNIQYKRITEYFGDRPFQELQEQDLNDWIVWLREVKKFRWETIVSTVGLMRRFQKWLKKAGHRKEANFHDLVSVPKDEDRGKVFTHDQYLKLREASVRYPSRMELTSLIIIGWNTGLRIHDARFLKWETVDWANDLIRVSPMKRESVNQVLEIPMEPELREHLRFLWEQREDESKVRYILPRIVARCEQHNKLTLAFRTLCDRVGLEDYSFHSFRRAFVTRLLNAGVDAKIIGAMTGQSVHTVYKYAKYVTHDAKVKAMARARAAMHEARLQELQIETPVIQ